MPKPTHPLQLVPRDDVYAVTAALRAVSGGWRDVQAAGPDGITVRCAPGKADGIAVLLNRHPLLHATIDPADELIVTAVWLDRPAVTPMTADSLELWSRLTGSADDDELAALLNLACRAGIMWRCDCGDTQLADRSVCDSCGHVDGLVAA